VKALVFTGPGQWSCARSLSPQVADGETLVHVRSAGICGRELRGVRHPGLRVAPLIMGHDFTDVSDSGHPVVINPLLPCS
jgi:threonine dehydrogenase-like Zn-dependent dehydrogenase